MIVTLTANPSIDRTIELGGPLERGAVIRAASTTDEPGGKGVNVSRALTAAGIPTLAVLPAAADDPLLTGLRAQGVAYAAAPIDSPVRTNITIAEPDGTTTKINAAGFALTTSISTTLADALANTAATWVVLAGSLPPGVPTHWYAEIIDRLADHGCKVAVDTSDAPLLALASALPRSAPHLMKPNSEELAQLTGGDANALESAADAGDPLPAATAARGLVAQGVERVLVTLGAAGALLVDAHSCWFAAAPPIAARSTVGAGDCALAGYLIAHQRGADGAQCLRTAVAYGSAAASLPGTAVPRPDDIDLESVSVTSVSGTPVSGTKERS